MASTVAARRLTDAHRLAQVRLGVATIDGMLGLWGLLDVRDLDGSTDRWLRATAPYVQAQRRASAVMAADYARAFRQLELGTLAGFAPLLAGPVDPVRLATSLLVTGPVHLRAQMRRGLREASEAAAVSSARAAMRHAGDGGRDTVIGSVERDTQAVGWARVTSGDPCAFCAMLASRGPVYKTRESAGFRAHGTSATAVHDHDACTFEPVYIDDGSWPPKSREFRELWDTATAGVRGPNAQRKAFREAYEARLAA